MEKNKSLKAFNTFGVESHAEWFVEARTADEVWSCLKDFQDKPIMVLGGGSNLLLTKDIDGVVLKISLKGISIVEESENHVILEVQGGEIWHEVVEYCLEHDFGGIENLALIPGQMGTAPIQNIGAYGVELKDVFDSCVALNRSTGQKKVFNLDDCQFGYRESVFKNALKNQFVILSVRMRLTKKQHQLKLDYGSISEVLEQKGVKNPSIRHVAQAVIAIRQSKLPDPKELGNSGSFFKNPIVPEAEVNRLLSRYPDLPSYPAENELKKVPAGWLIQRAGLKGFRQGDAGVHKNQALVLVNYGKATGLDIKELAQFIQQKVLKDFGITLTPEVNII
jgi:UDP-N-acetylmuramate dehydrogenase